MDPVSKSIAHNGFKWSSILIGMLTDIDRKLRRAHLPNITQSSILLYLNMNDSVVRIGVLSEDLNLKPNTTTASINKLEEKSYLIRKQTGADKRGIELILTQEGKECFKKIIKLLQSYLRTSEVFWQLCDSEALNEKMIGKNDDEMICLFIIHARKFILELSYISKSFSMNLSSLRVLAYIGFTKKNQRMINISSDLNMHQNVLSISATQLINKHLATKTTDTSDRRAVHLIITQAGKKTLNKTVPIMNDLVSNSILSLESEAISI